MDKSVVEEAERRILKSLIATIVSSLGGRDPVDVEGLGPNLHRLDDDVRANQASLGLTR